MRVPRLVVASALGVLACLGLTVVVPSGTAQAFTSLQACYQNPATLALCAEAMGTTIPTAGVASAATGTTTATGGTAAVAVASSAPSWAAGLSAVLSAGAAAVATSVGGLMTMFGVPETQIATDPEYVGSPVLGEGVVACNTQPTTTVCMEARRQTVTIGSTSCNAYSFKIPGVTAYETYAFRLVRQSGSGPFNVAIGGWDVTGSHSSLRYPGGTLAEGSDETPWTASTNCIVLDIWYFAGRNMWATEASGWVPSDKAAYDCGVAGKVCMNLLRAVEEGGTPVLVGTNRVTLTCSNGEATTDVVQMYPYDVTAGSPISFPETQCAPGWVLESMKVETQQGASGTWTEIATGQNPPEVIAAPLDFPNCVSDVGSETCYLRLYDGSDWCGPGAVACPYWVDQETAEPGRFRCLYGPYSVPLTDCSAYRKPGVGVLPNRDVNGDPIAITAPAPAPAEIPPAVDPVTGTQLPNWIAPDAPGGGTTLLQSGECFPSGWGLLNPVEWIYRPIQCGLEWAFVPRTSVMTATVTGLQTAMATRAPAQIAEMVSGWEFAPPPGGCGGITVPLSDVWSEVDDWHILNACPGEPLAPLAGLCSVIVGIGSLLGAAISCTRSIAGVVQFGGVNGD